MATAAQIRANQENAKRSSGPRNTDRTRFNNLKHGLRAEQVVLPGEDPDAFEAEKQAWFDDWKPGSHTRAVLVERAAVASWKLRRATRCERARLHDIAADVAHEFDTGCRELVVSSTHLLPRDPAFALSRLRSHAAGIECLIGLWGELAQAVESGWTSREAHHDRLLNLLGHKAGSEPAGLEAAAASLALLNAPDPAAAAALRALCAGRLAELREERSTYWDLPVFRRHLIDVATAPTSKEAQLLHRYEVAHEKSLRSTLRQLLTLEKSGADLPDEPEPEPEAVAAAPAGPDGPEKRDTKPESSMSSEKLASVGAAPATGGRPGRPAGVSGGRRGPTGAVPSPGPAPNRR